MPHVVPHGGRYTTLSRRSNAGRNGDTTSAQGEFLAGKGGAAGEERTKKKHGLADYWMQKLYAEYGTKMIVCTFPELQGAPAGAPAGANVDELDD